MNAQTTTAILLSLLSLCPCRGAAPSEPQPSPRLICTYDARPLRQLDARQPDQAARHWDTMHLLAALQGLANRNAPQFYLFYCAEFGTDTDQFWFDWLRGEDGWLRDSRIRPLTNVTEVLNTFAAEYTGLVVYDPAVPATSNLASTAAGCDRLLPVRFDPSTNSLFHLLTQQCHYPVKLWLVNPDGSPKFTGKGLIPDSGEPSTGSAKADAYRWAAARYLRTGKCDPKFAGYYLDAFWLRHPTRAQADMHTLSNHDYFIAHRAFFFDLSPWADEAPSDDTSQPLGLDRATLLSLLGDLYHQAHGAIIKVGGFTPWPYKYTTHGGAGKHDGVPTEWEYARLITQYNGYMEADAAGPGAMANASLFQHYPLSARYPQPNMPPGAREWKARGYLTEGGKVVPRLFVGHYAGDYDSPSWLYKAVAAYFPDPARGQAAIGWAFNPNLADRAPQALAYAYRHATTNDFFIAGDSGAGYLNVRGLTHRPESKLPSGLAAWTRHCAPYYERWGMTITGFVLDGASGAAGSDEFAAYRGFSPAGLGTHFEPRAAMLSGIPTCPERDLPDGVEEAAKVIAATPRDAQKPTFFWARSILKSPKWYADLSLRLRTHHPEVPVEVVDPYTFFGLVREAQEAKRP